MKMTSTVFRVTILQAAMLSALFVPPVTGRGSARAAAQEAKVKMCGADLSTSAGRPGTLYKQSYALVVGVSKHTSWPRLQGTKDDVIAVEDALKKHGFTVKVLLDPTRNQFFKEVDEFRSKHDLSNPARFLLYFAGHGYTDKAPDGRELGYIIPADAPLPAKDPGGFRTTAVSMNEVERLARDISSCHAMFVFDSCFSGILLTATRDLAPIPILARMQPVRMFVTAGTENQTVSDNSVFREAFVRALDGEADTDDDGYVTGIELGEFLLNTVSHETGGAQTPLYGKIRDPKLAKGDFIFALRQKEDTPPPPALPFMLGTHYYPSGWMGDPVEAQGTGKLSVSAHTENVEGKLAVATRIEYRQGQSKGWAGIYWQHPNKNWGEKPGLSLVGAKQISFWARGERGGEIVEFISGGVGLEEKNKPHYDRYKKSLGPIPLSDKWKKYVIDLSNVPARDLSSVVGAFAWVAVGGYDKEGRLVTYVAELKVE